MAELSLPICERISRAIVTVLQGVTADEGYQTDIVEVLRSTKKPPGAKHWRIILHEGDDEELGDDDTPDGFKAWVRPYIAQIYVLPSGLAADAVYMTWLNITRADVAKALAADVTLGGLSHNLEIRNPQQFLLENDAGGVMVPFDVMYRTDENDPYQPAP